jgi:NDP-sugar pyrophosphorylase family protein
MKVIILAGGKGTRLLPHTVETPKTLLKINGVTIIERILESLPIEIDEIFIIVKHLQDKIKITVGEKYKNINIKYIEQGDKTGTFGALLSARDIFTPKERFLITNGDDIHRTSEYEECLKYPRSMAVQKRIMPNYYRIEKNTDGYFAGFFTQSEEEKKNGTLVATGVYVLDSNIFDHPGVILSSGEYGLPQTVSEQSKQYPVKVVETDGWFSVNTTEDLKNAQDYFK